MLVLTRTDSQSINIGDNIVIHILETKGKQVRVGIEAPKEVSIVRTELIGKPHQRK